MTTNYGPYIPRNGLVLCVDPANPRSYPGSGSTLFDLSGNGFHGTITGAAWSSSNSGVFQFTGSSATRIDIPSVGINTGTYTVIVASRYTDNTFGGRTLSVSSGNWLLGHHDPGGYCNRYFAGGWVNQPTAISDNEWRIYAGTGNTGSDSWSFYSNGSHVVTNGGGSAGPANFRIGGWTGSEWSKSEVGVLLAYNRVLTDSEIFTVWSSYRTRYNI